MSEYNGWSNYETWCVNLWLDNKQGSYDDKRDIIRNASTKYEAEKALEEYASEMLPDLGASMAADLLGAAAAIGEQGGAVGEGGE